MDSNTILPSGDRLRSDSDISLYNLTPTPSTSQNRIDLDNPQPQPSLDNDAELQARNLELESAPRELVEFLQAKLQTSSPEDMPNILSLVEKAKWLEQTIDEAWDQLTVNLKDKNYLDNHHEDYLRHLNFVIGHQKTALRHLERLRQDPSYQFTFQVEDGVPKDLEPAIHLDKLDAAPPLSRLKKLAGALTGVLMAGGIIALLLSNPVGWGLLAGGLVILAVILAHSAKEHRNELVQWAAGGLLLAPLAVIWVMAGYYVEPKEEGA